METSRAWPGKYFLLTLVHGRSLIYQLVRRDFEQRYVGSVAGWVWGVIHPLVLLAVYTFVFSYAFQMTLPKGEVTDNYPLFLMSGMLPWLFFSESVQRSASSLLEYSNLIKKSVFPAEVVPLSILLSNVISHLLALVLLVAAVAIWLKTLSFTLALIPVYMVLLALFSLGLSWFVAGLHVYLRDTAQVLAVALTAWFWLTPIFLSEERLQQIFPPLLTYNPLAYVMRAYRDCILGARLPHLGELPVLAGFAVAAFLLGGIFFRYSKRGFADVL